MQPGLSIHTSGKAPTRSDTASSAESTRSPPPVKAEMAPVSRENRPMTVGGDEPEPPYPIHLEGSVTHGFGRGARFLGIPTGTFKAYQSSSRTWLSNPLTCACSQLARLVPWPIERARTHRHLLWICPSPSFCRHAPTYRPAIRTAAERPPELQSQPAHPTLVGPPSQRPSAPNAFGQAGRQ